MTGDIVTTWSWVFWLAIILIFIVVEVLSLSFVFLMLAVGGLGGLIAGLLGAPWWVQIIVAAVLSLILLFLVRPPLLHAMRRGSDPARSNVDALLGIRGTVVSSFDDGRGQVKLANGETWTSRLAAGTAETTLAEGEKVVVTSIDGATAVVTPVQ
ncbi:MAG TPA: NfeD family protein [Pseudolysinimonas sp.]|nr:NfeD family protein [Pseudolysinimonas sp.]